MNKDTEKTRSFSIDRWIPNRLGDQVNQVHVHLTGFFFQISPNTKLNFHLCVFRAVSHWTSSPPWLCSNWYLGEGRLGNHFQTKTEQTKGSFGYQVYSTAGQRNTNQWLFCTWWPSLSNYLLFVDILLSFTHRSFSALQLEMNSRTSRLSMIGLMQIFFTFTDFLNYVSTLFVKNVSQVENMSRESQSLQRQLMLIKD